MLQPAHALVSIVRLRISAQKLVLISSRVARTIMWAFLIGSKNFHFLGVSYVHHDWPNSYVCMMVERSDMSKFTEGSWQGSFTVNNERAVLASKQSRKSWYSRPKKTIQVQAFRRKLKRLRLFSHNKKAYGFNRGKRNCICDHILLENICRNINHRN